MAYQIIFTYSAKSDLEQIAHFIASDSENAQIAIGYIEKLQSTIASLTDFPNRGNSPQYRLLRLQGYRFIICVNHLVFYKIFQETQKVIIYRILHQRSSYQNLL